MDQEIMNVSEEEARTFLKKVKLCLQGGRKNIYESFIELFRNYKSGLICKKEVYNGVRHDLFVDHPDLLKEFERLFMRSKMSNLIMNPKYSCIAQGTSSGHNNKASARKKQNQRNQDAKDILLVEDTKEKGKDKCGEGYSMTRGDLWSFETCTPSYRILPEDYPVSASTQRSDIDNQVLNDHVMLIAPEIFSQPRQRSKDVKVLDDREDARYEKDMYFEYVKAAAENVELVLNKLQMEQLDLNTPPILIEEHLTAQNLRCIEKLYGDYGMDIIQMVNMNPSEALHAILDRLRQKLRFK